MKICLDSELSSLLPVVLGAVPLLFFILLPASNEVINTILWTAGTIGLASPARDYVEALICLVKVPVGCSIQSGNGGFGNWSIDKKQRLMFAAMLVGDFYCADRTLLAQSTLGSTVAMVIAEEVAIMACMMAATSATTTSH